MASVFNFEPKRVVFKGSCYAVYDVSDLLPRHPNFPHGFGGIDPNKGQPYLTVPYRINPRRNITHLVLHQTGGGYRDAWTALLEEARFFVRDPSWKENAAGQWKWTGEGRGWPGFAYTFWVPFKPIVWRDDEGVERYLIFQTQPLSMISFHTGGVLNASGVGMALQGYFLAEKDGITVPRKGTDGSPSQAQLTSVAAFVAGYAQPELKVKVLTGHWEHGKPSCPGDAAKALVIKLRDDLRMK